MKRLLLSVVTLLVLLSACKKEQDVIGLELQGADELLGNSFCDTVTISAYSLLQDSVVTRNLSNCTFGMITDPVFGKTKAGFYTQFDLSGSNINFGNNPVLDSVVFTLPYTGYFGDTTSSMKIRVYELTENLSSSETYYEFSTTAHSSSNLTYDGNYTLVPHPTSATYVDTVKNTPHLRIRLADAFGINRILNSNALIDNNSFQNDLKGFYVEVESVTGTGCLIYSNLLSSLAGLTVYYKNDGNNNQQKYTFSISSSKCAFYTHYDHFDYSAASSDFKNQVLNGQQNLGKSTLYLQGTSGVMTRMTFPYLANSFFIYLIINKAELVISDISEDEATFFPPAKIGLQLVKQDNTLSYLLDDEIYTSTNYFGGEYNSSKKEYRFRITKYVQQLVLGSRDPDNGINIVVNGAGIHANRLVFAGTEPGELLKDKRLRLEIYYTTY
ncbi:MAG: DUF4270 domain-containing protein [Bacteroidales bacterium]|nr:DUF4270 domain-containing protein [Bacteroidales bacterium]